jgi:thioredoxin-dependent peroxiredoxin
MCNVVRFLSIALVFAGVLVGCGDSYPGLPAEGTPAPDFTLMNQDGKPVSLKEYRGQWVVLYFYSRDFAKQGTADLHSFQRDLPKLQGLHTVILAVSADSVATHKAFASQEQLPFTLLADVGQKVSKQYGSFRTTHFVYHVAVYSTFIIDPKGNIAHVFFDFGPADPGGEVLSAVTALQHA